MANNQSTKLHPNTKDISGKRFGRLIALSISHSKKTLNFRGTKLYWNCVCDCGNTAIIAAPNLYRGDTRSCGCYQKERAVSSNTTHGMSNSTEFDIWNSMKQRCTNPANRAFRDYGGRGIRVCSRWTASFAHFLEDVGPRPKGMQLERMNNEKGYEPGNVRWATRIEQARNKRNTILVSSDGLTLSLKEWSTRTGIRYGTLWSRLKHGLPLFTYLTHLTTGI